MKSEPLASTPCFTADIVDATDDLYPCPAIGFRLAGGDRFIAGRERTLLLMDLPSASENAIVTNGRESMVENTFTVSQFLIHIATSAPLLGALVAGLVICYRQRQRRPRVSKLLGGAMLAELIWLTCGWPLLSMAIMWLGISNSYSMSDTGDSSWILRMILHSLPGSMISAVIWGTVLWAVLKVEDWQNDTAPI